MNKILKFSSVLAIVFAFISCEKVEITFSDNQECITVTSQADAQVKAGYEGISVLPANFYMEISSPSFSDQMTREGTSNKYNFPTGKKLTWGDTDISNVTIKAITEPSGYKRETGEMSVESDQSPEENVLASDLLGAVTGYGVNINKNNINISFKHLMSKLYVTYNVGSNVKVTSVSLNKVCRSGTFSFSSMIMQAGNTRDAITMYHNSTEKYAEAIFFPYTPSGANDVPEISVTVEGSKEPIKCAVSLNNITRFESGKRYIMNIVITGSTIEGAEVTVKEWNQDTNSIQVPGERVLWIGTSIPAGDLDNGTRSYPYLVGDAMTCEIVNKAVPGSLVVKSKQPVVVKKSSSQTTKEYNDYLKSLYVEWDKYVEGKTNSYSGLQLAYGGLAQTDKDIDNYKPDLVTIGTAGGAKDPSAWADKHIQKLKELSYLSRIIPYIKKTDPNHCTTVIIDHGFNDRGSMITEAIGYANGNEIVDGYDYLMKVKQGTVSYDAYLKNLDQWPNLKAAGNYIVDLTNVINAIKAENSNVRVIIGNYFTLNCPFITKEYMWASKDHDLLSKTYMNYCKLICYYNEAVAGVNKLDIVNVYESLRIDEDKYWNFNDSRFNEYYSQWERQYDTWYNNNKDKAQDERSAKPAVPGPMMGIDDDHPIGCINYDSNKFCPDGVHPFHPDALKAIAEIYVRELDGIIGSRN